MAYIAKRCAIRYDPPTLLLYYEVKDTGKLRRRSVPIRNSQFERHQDIIEHLLKNSHHAKYLEQFSRQQLEKLVGMVIDHLKKVKGIADGSAIDLDNTDLNKLDDERLSQVKELMNETFKQNSINPGDTAWQYDIEVDFNDPAVSGSNGKIESGWDEDDESDMEF